MVFTRETLDKNQKRCLNEILEAINEGCKRISVLAPVGSGSCTLSYVLAKELSYNKTVALASSQASTRRKVKDGIKEYNVSLTQRRDADVFIFHYLHFKDRKAIQGKIKDNQIVISFIRAGQEIYAFEPKATRAFNFEGEGFLVVKCEHIIDIRDVFLASNEEKVYIDNQIIKKKRELKENHKKAEEENSFLKRVIALQNQILECVGIPTDKIQASLKRLEKKRQSLDINDEEQIQALQDEVVKDLENLKKKYANDLAILACQNELSFSIDDNVWKRLDSKTRSYLITAKFNYETLIKVDNIISTDYSGVCLLLTKAVELETSKRFFDEYKAYLTKMYSHSYNLWPREMLDFSRGKTRVIKYTLGTFYNIAQDMQGNLYPSFFNYAKNKLYTKLSPIQVEREIRQNCVFVERVRQDYRNPAAHTGAFDKITAKECFEYIIEVEKVLQKIIKNADF